ncbi:hypothetical protein RHMOL_Rhmol13G0191500 [Rhododendron molle]|uniref:Uncharacterized protein n=1 Tax=Rhododendron molle TaxID=49168 RepID=A0ACC0L9Q8_RHOML|nr:hypothetical protein RHMOL_Rhmol13G0191500 [Rhododendron molle]
MDPSNKNSEDKSEVVRSSSSSPGKKEAAMKRKASEVAAVEAIDKTSSPTPMKKVTPTKKKKLNTVKIKITHHGKKPETEEVYERKRKRPNREYEGVIDLQTPIKRVTRSSEALQKMQRGNDSEEKKFDKGIKRKTRSQVPKDGCLNRKPKVNKKEKGDEEEEELNEEEGDEEEKGKGKKGHRSKGFKGKEVKGKQEKKEPGMSNKKKGHIQYSENVIYVVFSSELEPNDEEEELYRFSPVPEHEADGKPSNLKTAVDNSGDEAVEDTSDEETDSEQDEVVNLRGIIRKLSEENAEKDRIISDLRKENKDKNATIFELRGRIAKHTQNTTPGFGFEGISAQFDKHHLEHENVTLQTEIGGMLIEKDIIEEKLEVAGDIIDDFVTHSVAQTYQTGEDLGEKESKDNEDHAGGDKQEIEKEVEEKEEEEGEEEEGGGGEEEGEEKGGGFEIDAEECGPEHIMVPDAEVDSTTVEAYTSILECNTPKGKRGKTRVKVKSSSLTRGVKKTFTRVEKRLDDYVYRDLKKGAKNKSKQKWNPSDALLIDLLPNTDANLLHQIVECSDADLCFNIQLSYVKPQTSITN